MRKIISLTFLIGILSVLSGCIAGGVDAGEWIVSQYSSFTDIQEYCEKLDDLVSLYATSAIDQDTYQSSINELSDELTELEKNRTEEKIKPGTHTTATMTAKEGYEDIWISLRTLVNTMSSDTTVISDPDALSYLYMAYQEQFVKDINKYIEGYNETVTAEEE